ncbi:hypothetical protein BaRGS_00001648, partial [Batillaria attramentaria]
PSGLGLLLMQCCFAVTEASVKPESQSRSHVASSGRSQKRAVAALSPIPAVSASNLTWHAMDLGSSLLFGDFEVIPSPFSSDCPFRSYCCCD